MARNRYIDAVRAFNVTVREFPTNLTANWFDFEVKPNFTVENEAEISTAPRRVVRHLDAVAAGDSGRVGERDATGRELMRS